jgi:Subtilase family
MSRPYTQVFVLLLALMMEACASTSPRRAIAPDTHRYTDDERLIIITVDNEPPGVALRPGSTPGNYGGAGAYTASDAARRALRTVASDYHLSAVMAWPIASLMVHCGVFRIPMDASRENLLAQIGRDQRVRLAQPMNEFQSRGQTYNDPYAELQRGFKGIDAGGAQQWSRGEQVRVAVIDTGIDITHPDFGGRIASHDNFVDGDAAQFDRDMHGTEVAGVISASANNRIGIVGVAPGVQLMAFKACWQTAPGNDAARCNSLTLAQALVAAADHQAQVVNLSLTGPPDPLLNALIRAGASRGILYVGAAPRGGDPAGFPAGAPEVIRVDTSEDADSRSDVLFAPGRDIVTLVPGGRYDYVTGASFATAHVTGAVALLAAKSRRIDRSAVYRLLRESVRVIPFRTREASIDACSAMAALVNQPRCTSRAEEVPVAVAAKQEQN